MFSTQHAAHQTYTGPWDSSLDPKINSWLVQAWQAADTPRLRALVADVSREVQALGRLDGELRQLAVAALESVATAFEIEGCQA